MPGGLVRIRHQHQRLVLCPGSGARLVNRRFPRAERVQLSGCGGWSSGGRFAVFQADGFT
jgi:hypothetical protein